MNHIATAEPSASGVDYSLLIMEAAMAVKMAVEMAAVSMEKPSGGTSPLWQRAGTETPVPQILAS